MSRSPLPWRLTGFHKTHLDFELLELPCRMLIRIFVLIVWHAHFALPWANLGCDSLSTLGIPWCLGKPKLLVTLRSFDKHFLLSMSTLMESPSRHLMPHRRALDFVESLTSTMSLVFKAVGRAASNVLPEHGNLVIGIIAPLDFASAPVYLVDNALIRCVFQIVLPIAQQESLDLRLKLNGCVIWEGAVPLSMEIAVFVEIVKLILMHLGVGRVAWIEGGRIMNDQGSFQDRAARGPLLRPSVMPRIKGGGGKIDTWRETKALLGRELILQGWPVKGLDAVTADWVRRIGQNKLFGLLRQDLTSAKRWAQLSDLAKRCGLATKPDDATKLQAASTIQRAMRKRLKFELPPIENFTLQNGFFVDANGDAVSVLRAVDLTQSGVCLVDWATAELWLGKELPIVSDELAISWHCIVKTRMLTSWRRRSSPSQLPMPKGVKLSSRDISGNWGRRKFSSHPMAATLSSLTPRLSQRQSGETSALQQNGTMLVLLWLRQWKTVIPRCIIGGLPGRSCSRLSLRNALLNEHGLSINAGIGGFSLDIAKCFNALGRLPALHPLRYGGFGSQHSQFWYTSLCKMTRTACFLDTSSCPSSATTGLPEGDPSAVCAIVTFGLGLPPCPFCLRGLVAVFSMMIGPGPQIILNTTSWPYATLMTSWLHCTCTAILPNVGVGVALPKPAKPGMVSTWLSPGRPTPTGFRLPRSPLGFSCAIPGKTPWGVKPPGHPSWSWSSEVAKASEIAHLCFSEGTCHPIWNLACGPVWRWCCLCWCKAPQQASLCCDVRPGW